MRELDSRHVFTDRVDLAWKSFFNSRKKSFESDQRYLRLMEQMKERFPSAGKAEIQSEYEKQIALNAENPLIIVQYPHAVSAFSPSRISLWAIVQDLTRRRKNPVMVIQLNIEDDREKSTVEWIAWGDGENCIADIRLSDGYVRPESGRLESVVARLPHLFATDPTVVISYTDLPPLEYVARLERELGIFIGSTPLENFLATCTKVKETEYATVYKSDRLA